MVLIFTAATQAGNLPPVQTVFVILFENHNWSDFKGSTDAPFINGTLLPMASHCEQYYNPPGLHPSEPNYLWLEAGTNFGIFDNNDPANNHQNTTNHLAAQLRSAGISWKTYQEDIVGNVVPLTVTNGYRPDTIRSFILMMSPAPIIRMIPTAWPISGLILNWPTTSRIIASRATISSRPTCAMTGTMLVRHRK